MDMQDKDFPELPGQPTGADPFASFMDDHADESPEASESAVALDGSESPPQAVREGEPHSAWMIENVVKDYRIVRTVSETSTSIVYKAEDIRTKRRVAIKVIYNRGVPDFDRINRARAEIERLRHLSHPGIAALLDAGMTNEGHCYFVSEFIKGVSLNEYISIHKLSQEDRLSIFARICEAVQYSHQKCLIHRDLRPSNIIIDGKCNPKIVGFGVAGVTDVDVGPAKEGSGKRELREFLAYKSPEQVAGRLFDTDVRSEVYTLGVILYELLTDGLPYSCNSENGKEIVDAVANEMPPKPSAVKTTLRGDLEAITLKALEKQPSDRYQTVAALSQDLENYFDQRPVGARRAGAMYEFRKLATRYKSRTISVVIMTLAVLAFGLHIHLTTRQAGQRRALEIEQRLGNEIARVSTARQMALDESKRMQAQAEATAAEMATLREKISGFQGQVAAVDDHRDELTERAERAETRAQVADRIAKFWPQRIAGVSGRKSGPTIDAVRLASGAIEAADTEFADAPLAKASIFNDAGGLYADIGRNEEAVAALDRALKIRGEELGDANPDTIDTLNTLSAVLFRNQRPGDAEQATRRLANATREVFGAEDARTLTALNNLGLTLISQGKFDEAEKCLREALEGRRKSLGEDDLKTAASWQNLGKVLFELGRYEDSAKAFESALTALTHHNANSAAVNEVRIQLGGCLLKLNRAPQAMDVLKPAAEYLEKRFGPRQSVTRQCLTLLGEALDRAGKKAEAADVRKKLEGGVSTANP